MSSESLISRRVSITKLPTDPTQHIKCGAVIGEGAYGKVYKGSLVASGEIVAVKVVPITDEDQVRAVCFVCFCFVFVGGFVVRCWQ